MNKRKHQTKTKSDQNKKSVINMVDEQITNKN